MTLIMDRKVHHISTVLRMGTGGNKVDNASAGGITCGVKENGQLKDIAFNAHGIDLKYIHRDINSEIVQYPIIRRR